MSHSTSPTDPLLHAQHRINALRLDLNAKLRIIDDLKNQEKTHLETIHKLEKRVRDVESQYDLVQKVTEEKENITWERVEKERAIIEENKRELEEEKKKIILEREEMKSKIEEYRLQMLKSDGQKTAKDSEYRKLQQLYAASTLQYQQEIATIKEEKFHFITQHEEERFILSKKLEENKSVVEESTHKIAQITREMNDIKESKDSEISLLKQEISRLSTDLQREKSTFSQYKSAYDSLKKSTAESREKELGAAHNKYRDILKNTETEIADLKSKLTVSQNILKDLDEWEKDRDSTHAELEEVKWELGKIRGNVESNKRVYEDNMMEKEIEIGEWRGKYEEKCEELEGVKREIERKNITLKAYHDMSKGKKKSNGNTNGNGNGMVTPKKDNNPISNVPNSASSSAKKSGGFFDKLFNTPQKTSSSSSSPSPSTLSSPPKYTQSSSLSPNANNTNDAYDTDNPDDIEDEIVVSLSTRVESLSLEREKMRDMIGALEKSIREERMISEALRNQIVLMEKKENLSPSSPATSPSSPPLASLTPSLLPTDPLLLNKLLSDTLLSYQQSEKKRTELETEMKKLREGMEVRMREVREGRVMIKMLEEREVERREKEKEKERERERKENGK